MSRLMHALACLLWITALATAGVAVLRLEPVPTDAAATTLAGGVRVIGAGLIAYLGTVTVANLVGGALRHWAEAATPAPLRPALAALTFHLLATGAPTGSDVQNPVPAESVHSVEAEQAPPTLRRLPDLPAPAGTLATTSTARAASTPATAVSTGLGPWVIQPGQHLWHVAEATLVDMGLHRGDASTAAYLEQLILHNRAGLPVPDNPDLVFPGTVVERPLPDGPSLPA